MRLTNQEAVDCVGTAIRRACDRGSLLQSGDTRTARIWSALLMFVIGACADPARDHALDPVTAPLIEMSDPVLQGGSVLISWRYFAEGNDLTELVVRKAIREGDRFSDLELGGVLPEGGSQVARVGVSTGAPGWQTGSVLDESIRNNKGLR